eukprot:338482-Rhodomonas_salina.1
MRPGAAGGAASERAGPLPAGVRIIGLAGELGYVAQGDTVMAAVGGHRLAALVVESERVVEVMEKEAGRCAVLRG